MRPTLRGFTVAAIVGTCLLMAAQYGARALNAIAAPAALALVASAIQAWRLDPPTVTRERLPPGYPDETRRVEIHVDGGGLATVRDSVPDGVMSEEPEIRATLPATVSYRIGLTDRGEWAFGPVTVTVTDLLGLFQRRIEIDATATQLVYPALYDLREGSFAALIERTTTVERQAFESIREYVPGDPLRDVHWKSSAKRGEAGDLVVKEFVGEENEGSLTIAASASEGHGNEMAAAAASLGLLALDAGLSVSVVCPGGEVRADRGEDHRRDVLELLARTGHGQVDRQAWADADVRVRASAEGVSVEIAGEEHTIGPSTDRANAVADGGWQQ